MNLQSTCRALSAVALTYAMVTVGPAYAQLPDGGLLPMDQSGYVTAVGCLVPNAAVFGGNGTGYALANPKPGPVNSVTEARCSADTNGAALDLDDTKEEGINEQLVGHWVEINGKLEKKTHHFDKLRQFEVRSIRVLPVVPPRTASVTPPPAPPTVVIQEVPMARAEIPAAEPTPTKLPKTASPLPTVGLLGLISLAGGFIVRTVRSHEGA